MDTVKKISLNEEKIFHELNFLSEDLELRGAVQDCVRAQKKASKETLKTLFKSDPQAVEKVAGWLVLLCLNIGDPHRW